MSLIELTNKLFKAIIKMIKWLSTSKKAWNSLLKRDFRNKSEVYKGINPLNPFASNQKIIPEFSHISSAEEKE